MVRTPSTMLPLGTAAPDFSLMNVDSRMVSLSDFNEAPALLVAFLCNHCPYVIHVADHFAMLAHEYMRRGVAVVGISSNDVSNYPADSPEQMVAEAEARGYGFPYLYDETQEVAISYRAACTPDFFLFDGDQKLVYRGQLDASRPDSGIPITCTDIRAALDAVLASTPGNLTDTLAIAALIQCLVKALSDEIDNGTYQHDCHPMMVRQNKWRATRFGTGALLVDSYTYQSVTVAQAVDNLVDKLTPVAANLGCEHHLERCRHIAASPSWADRQLSILAETGSVEEIVRQLTAESRLSP